MILLAWAPRCMVRQSACPEFSDVPIGYSARSDVTRHPVRCEINSAPPCPWHGFYPAMFYPGTSRKWGQQRPHIGLSACSSLTGRQRYSHAFFTFSSAVVGHTIRTFLPCFPSRPLVFVRDFQRPTGIEDPVQSSLRTKPWLPPKNSGDIF